MFGSCRHGAGSVSVLGITQGTAEHRPVITIGQVLCIVTRAPSFDQADIVIESKAGSTTSVREVAVHAILVFDGRAVVNE